MTSVIDRINKRAKYPAKINGETIYLRSMKRSERLAVMQFKDDEESFGFAIGVGLLNDDGTQAIERNAGESDKEFGKRVLETLDLSDDVRSQLVTQILKLSNGPTPEQMKAIEGN